MAGGGGGEGHRQTTGGRLNAEQVKCGMAAFGTTKVCRTSRSKAMGLIRSARGIPLVPAPFDLKGPFGGGVGAAAIGPRQRAAPNRRPVGNHNRHSRSTSVSVCHSPGMSYRVYPAVLRRWCPISSASNLAVPSLACSQPPPPPLVTDALERGGEAAPPAPPPPRQSNNTPQTNRAPWPANHGAVAFVLCELRWG